jgi:hypothetical protein
MDGAFDAQGFLAQRVIGLPYLERYRLGLELADAVIPAITAVLQGQLVVIHTVKNIDGMGPTQVVIKRVGQDREAN